MITTHRSGKRYAGPISSSSHNVSINPCIVIEIKKRGIVMLQEWNFFGLQVSPLLDGSARQWLWDNTRPLLLK